MAILADLENILFIYYFTQPTLKCVEWKLRLSYPPLIFENNIYLNTGNKHNPYE